MTRDWTDADLKAVFADYRPRTPPRRHQLVSLAWSLPMKRVAYWHGIGTGKSLTALYTHDLWGTERHLIVCPNSVVGEWVKQIRQHLGEEPVVLRGSREDRRDLLALPGRRTFVVNYEGLLVLFCDREERTTKEGKAKTAHLLDADAILDADLDGVTADECHCLANEKAVQTRVFHALSMAAERAIIMTGTPISTSDEDLWAEYWCLDGGVTLGGTKWPFLRRHFRQKFFGGWQVKSAEERRVLLGRVAPVTLRFSREECVDLPPRTYETRRCQMSADQERLYALIANGQTWNDGGRTFGPVDPSQAANKLGQVAGGFFLWGDEAVRLADNPKADLLAELLRDVGDEKVIVFHAYVEEGRIIESVLDRQGIGYASLRGEVVDKEGAVTRFLSDPECRVMVAHPKSGGVGLNLQAASVAVFWSNGMSTATVRQQAEGRIYRQGQERPVVIVDLELEGSLDERHLERIEDQADLQAAALEFVRQYGKKE